MTNDDLNTIQVQLTSVRQLVRVISDYREDLSGLSKQDIGLEFLAIEEQQAAVEFAIDTLINDMSDDITTMLRQGRREPRDNKQ